MASATRIGDIVDAAVCRGSDNDLNLINIVILARIILGEPLEGELLTYINDYGVPSVNELCRDRK